MLYMYFDVKNCIFFFHYSLFLFNLRPKKLNYMFLRHRPIHLQPPAPKIFISFPVFILKNRLYIGNCQFRWAVICRHFATILFVDWLVRILKVEIFSGNYSDTSFYSISFNKIKNKKPPARIIF